MAAGWPAEQASVAMRQSAGWPGAGAGAVSVVSIILILSARGSGHQRGGTQGTRNCEQPGYINTVRARHTLSFIEVSCGRDHQFALSLSRK